MAATGLSGGIHVLDDFVCDAIPAAGVPRGDPTKPGRSAELPAALEDVERLAEALARSISDSANREETMARVLKLLADRCDAPARP